MLQHELTEKKQRCTHGYCFGATCSRCQTLRITRALGKHAKFQHDRLFGVVEITSVFDTKELADALKDLLP